MHKTLENLPLAIISQLAPASNKQNLLLEIVIVKHVQKTFK